jgi:hypothetical protein
MEYTDRANIECKNFQLAIWDLKIGSLPIPNIGIAEFIYSELTFLACMACITILDFKPEHSTRYEVLCDSRAPR